jgi:uncharacterized protein YjbI with pentapeptide repeats
MNQTPLLRKTGKCVSMAAGLCVLISASAQAQGDGTAPVEPKVFRMQSLSGENFSSAELGESKFYRARMNGANFTGADLSNASFEQCDLAKAIFTGAKFSDHTSLKQVNLNEADFAGVDLNGADFDSVNFRAASLQNTKNWGEVNRMNFEKANLRGADFSGVKTAPVETLWTGAIYDDKTVFPTGVNPAEIGAVKE